jgi:SAM-dependent methyltransferase
MATLIAERAHTLTPYPQVRMRCIACQRNVSTLRCEACGYFTESRDGIVHALLPERAAHFQKFVQDYEHIRAQEGRGACDEAFYLSLPWCEQGRPNSGQWRIRAGSYRYLSRRILRSLGRGSRVLDLGAGNCWLSHRLARRGMQPVAVDLLTNREDGLGAAVHYRRHLREPIPRFQAEFTRLPFADSQFDAAIFNASLHYAEDVLATVREALRCVRPGGLVLILDTPWYAREASGDAMVAERQASFRKQYNTASDSLRSLEFLTPRRLAWLEQALSIRWREHRPWYGVAWALRPWKALLLGRRVPSRFRMYVARKPQ